MNRRGFATVLNKKRAASGKGKESWSCYIFLHSYRTCCLLRLKGKREGKKWGGRQANWTEWLSPTSAALPEEAWLGCVCMCVCMCLCVCVSLLHYSGSGPRPHGIINYWFWRECVKSLAVIITLSAEIRECSAWSLPGQGLNTPRSSAVWRESQARLW